MPDFTKVDWGWGGMMTVFGMGTVFALLALLMLVLMLIGKLDQPKRAAVAPAPEAPALEAAPAADADAPAPAVTITDPSGLDEDTLAAIAVAVIKHADVRRQQAAPEMRTTAPGSQLFASRWVAVGRGQQNASFRRK